MITNFQIRQSASVPYLEIQITKDGRVPPSLINSPQGCSEKTVDPNAVDLTDVQSVQFQMFKCGRTLQQLAMGGQVVIVDAVNGIVQYQWNPLDTGVLGCFYGTFVVKFNSGPILIWPYIQESFSIEVL